MTVPGGVRSLTYSNKIDIVKELCPSELSGQACPLGEACEYQHFGSLAAPGKSQPLPGKLANPQSFSSPPLFPFPSPRNAPSPG